MDDAFLLPIHRETIFHAISSPDTSPDTSPDALQDDNSDDDNTHASDAHEHEHLDNHVHHHQSSDLSGIDFVSQSNPASLYDDILAEVYDQHTRRSALVQSPLGYVVDALAAADNDQREQLDAVLGEQPPDELDSDGFESRDEADSVNSLDDSSSISLEESSSDASGSERSSSDDTHTDTDDETGGSDVSIGESLLEALVAAVSNNESSDDSDDGDDSDDSDDSNDSERSRDSEQSIAGASERRSEPVQVVLHPISDSDVDADASDSDDSVEEAAQGGAANQNNAEAGSSDDDDFESRPERELHAPAAQGEASHNNLRDRSAGQPSGSLPSIHSLFGGSLPPVPGAYVSPDELFHVELERNQRRQQDQHFPLQQRSRPRPEQVRPNPSPNMAQPPTVIDLTEEPDSPVLQQRPPIPPSRLQRQRERNGGSSSGSRRVRFDDGVVHIGDEDGDVGGSSSGSQSRARAEAAARNVPVIDLTDDADEVEMVDQGGGASRRPNSGSDRSGNAGSGSRSGELLGMRYLAGLSALNFNQMRSISDLFNVRRFQSPQLHHHHHLPNNSNSNQSNRAHQRANSRSAASLRGLAGRHHQQPIDFDVQFIGHHALAAVMDNGNDLDRHSGRGRNHNHNPLRDNLPDLNYQVNGFLQQLHMAPPPGVIIGASPDKPPYQAPPPPQEGFTRDTIGGDADADEGSGDDNEASLVAVCVSCEEELAYDPDDAGADEAQPPPAKKKKTSRKEREEHHFWAATACGHVYCKRCFDNRRVVLKGGGTDKSAPPVGFRLNPTGKAILCAVDGCESEVTAKKAWVGLFV